MLTRALTLEICADSARACIAAERGGADRIELCTGLVEGGTTPSAGTLELALDSVRIPIVVLVRPRRGDCVFDELEIETALRDIAAVKRARAHGVAIGALLADGSIDVATLKTLREAAQPLPVTFHRAFDFVREPLAALDVLLALGVDRVLTSGGASDALSGADGIATLVRAGGTRIEVVAGGGVRPANVAELVARTGVRAVHASARSRSESLVRVRPAGLTLDARASPGAWERDETDAEVVRALRSAVPSA